MTLVNRESRDLLEISDKYSVPGAADTNRLSVEDLIGLFTDFEE